MNIFRSDDISFLQITDDRRSRVQKAMKMFDKLMTNKLFLKSLVQTLEHQNSLTMKDK